MGSRKTSLRERIHYKMDNYLARGSGALFLSLLITFLIAFVAICLLRLLFQWLVPAHEFDWPRHIYTVFLELTAPGNMNQDVKSPWIYKIAAILAGLTGLIIFSTLIATLTTALHQAIARLRQGHSRVLEQEHTLILGWTHRVPEIIRELVEANEETDTNPCVVVMADEEKPLMDEHLRNRVKGLGNTRVVTRSGKPSSVEALQRVSVSAARSVIVLADADNNAKHQDHLASDARVIKSVLALETAAPDADFPIVTELFVPRNRNIVGSIVPNRAKMVDAEEILAKVMIQTSRTSGLSVVYSELLSFEGCELYFYGAKWNGVTFGEAQFHFPDGVPIGIRVPGGAVQIRPALDTVLNDDTEILIVAEDDTTIDFRPQPVATPTDLPIPDRRTPQQIEKMLLVGWSPKATILISEYEEYVLEGSEVQVVVREITPAIRGQFEELQESCENLKLEIREMNLFDEAAVAALDPYSFNEIMILPQDLGADCDAERIDSETIMLLLLFRQLRKKLKDAGQSVRTKIVTEVLDSENQSLIHRAGVNDFIISNRVVSMLFAQISEEPEIQSVYDDLFQEDGSEIYVKPVELYFDTFPQTVTFADLMRLAQKRDEEACIGYKIASLSSDSKQNYGVKLIPLKTSTVELNPGDGLVVVAEDER